MQFSVRRRYCESWLEVRIMLARKARAPPIFRACLSANDSAPGVRKYFGRHTDGTTSTGKLADCCTCEAHQSAGTAKAPITTVACVDQKGRSKSSSDRFDRPVPTPSLRNVPWRFQVAAPGDLSRPPSLNYEIRFGRLGWTVQSQDVGSDIAPDDLAKTTFLPPRRQARAGDRRAAAASGSRRPRRWPQPVRM